MKGFTNKCLILMPSDEGLKKISVEKRKLYNGINNLISILNNLLITPYFLFTNLDEPENIKGNYKVIYNVHPEDRSLINSMITKDITNMERLSDLGCKFNKTHEIKRGMSEMQIAAIYTSRIKHYSKYIANDFNFIIDLQRSKGKILKVETRDGLLLLKADTHFYTKAYMSSSEVHVSKIFNEIENPTTSILNWKEK